MGELVRTNQLAFGPDAGANVPPEARCCDCCGAVTPCVCACGVSFCSRACLKEAWPEHAPSCAVVFKNGPVAYTTLNEREFGDARGPDDRPVSESCAHCGVRGATSRCSRCRQVVYCGRACQAAAWGRHRKRVKIVKIDGVWANGQKQEWNSGGHVLARHDDLGRRPSAGGASPATTTSAGGASTSSGCTTLKR